jgi:hypothetical protein
LHATQANNPCAGGIVETAAKFGLLPAASPVLQGYAGLLDPRDNSGGYMEPPLDDIRGAGLLLEEGAREWAWRLGRALAHHLAERSRHNALGASDAADAPSLHHSPLRLLVSNACALTIEATGAAGLTDAAGAAAARASAGGASVDVMLPQDHETPDPAEIADELQAAGAADAAAADPGGVVRRAWIDQVVVDKLADLSAAPLGSAATSAGDETDASALATVKLSFKVRMHWFRGLSWSRGRRTTLRATQMLSLHLLTAGVQRAPQRSPQLRNLVCGGGGSPAPRACASRLLGGPHHRSWTAARTRARVGAAP